MIITIDGPSGSGKTTIAKQVAKRLGITYFDTGAMYRSVSLGLLRSGIDLSDKKRIKEFLKDFSFDIRIQDGIKHYYIEEEDVTSEIRTPKVNALVSEVSAMRFVRRSMWKLQRKFAEKQSAVFEGRDLGTVVFPKAEVKVFLEADPKVRASRRLKEMREKLPEEAKNWDEEKVRKDLLRRDAFDSNRKLAPLKCPKEAKQIDTSNLEIHDIVDQIVALHRQQAQKLLPSWRKSKTMGFFYRFILFVSWYFFRGFYRLKVYGLEHFTKRAAIIAPNHNSYFDPPIVAISWPEEVHFLAKEYLFRPFGFGYMIRKLNSHPISGDVGDITVFKTIIQLLKEGRQIVLFPEGGRMDGEFGPIKPGIGMLLLRSKAAIVPTYIHNAYKVWGSKRKLPKLFGERVACVFGTPIVWESFSHLEKRKAQEQIAECLADSLKKLKKWYESGAEGVPP